LTSDDVDALDAEFEEHGRRSLLEMS
jgi:hypothetical protein